ncbi:DUF2461 domain-containing protein [uncultured Roseobacter sp.]|uniref:DUF2461 domain-containing protein n=1 Tax=uncultured Roseobacter sp. TaxID=114847 RepID=UPI002623E940|nr:DUF2461 domain-containing protein [uncultured Roseobacter sp.]
MPRFDHFSKDALGFLTDLKSNNSRDWFNQQRKTYEVEVREPTKEFACHMSDALGQFTGQTHDAKIYRINRDIRFSKDKTPYNTHIHISFAPQSDQANPPMWFFGLSPEKLSLGCGVFQYDKEVLTRFRAAMAGPQGAALIRLAEEMEAQGMRVSTPDLKRVPPGFDSAHPHGEALRRKGFSGWKDIEDPGFVTTPDLTSRTVQQMRSLRPIYDLLLDLS